MMLFNQIRLILNLFSCRCSILSNATVKCDTGVYQSLQAWKDHKLHIDHEVTSFSRFCKSHTAVRVSVSALLGPQTVCEVDMKRIKGAFCLTASSLLYLISDLRKHFADGFAFFLFKSYHF